MHRLHAAKSSRPAARQQRPLEFLGVGAARCGTTWLARCLSEHPEVFVPARKELKYFDNNFPYEPTLRRLRRHLSRAGPAQIRGELSPRYMTTRLGLERIAAGCPDVKIIVSLRNPVDRALSQYLYFRFNLKKEPAADFLQALEGPWRTDYLVKGLYSLHLRHVVRLFPAERITSFCTTTSAPGPFQSCNASLCSSKSIRRSSHRSSRRTSTDRSGGTTLRGRLGLAWSDGWRWLKALPHAWPDQW